MQRIDIKIKPSKQSMLLYTSLFFISIVIIFTLPVIFIVKAGLVVLTVLYGTSILYRYILLKHPKSIVRITSQNDKIWQLTHNKGISEAALTGDSTITSAGCILRFKVSNRYFKYSCIVFRDSVDSEGYNILLQL